MKLKIKCVHLNKLNYVTFFLPFFDLVNNPNIHFNIFTKELTNFSLVFNFTG